MKKFKISLILFSFLFILSAGFKPTDNLFVKLYNYSQTKDYFRLKDEFINSKNSLEIWQREVLSAFINSVFNNNRESNNQIKSLFEMSSVQIPDSIMAELLKTKQTNHSRLYEYKYAGEICNEILNNYSKFCDSTELFDLKNDGILWNAVKDAKPQEVIKTKDEKIQMEYDIAKLMNLNVVVNETEFKFVFDTGAGLSTLTESNAKKAGLKIIDSDFKVGTATDIKVNSKIAVAEQIKVGSIIIKNVLFFVLPDEALEFAGGYYKINGILGLPVIEAFDEIRISKDLELTIPLISSNVTYQNLGLDGLVPIFQGIINKDTLVFKFDSGAMNSILYQPYYILHRTEINSNYTMKKIKFGGAGGDMEVNGFVLDELNLTVGNKTGKLKDVSLLAENYKPSNEHFYGNIGKDFIGLFNGVTLNFEKMGISFN